MDVLTYIMYVLVNWSLHTGSVLSSECNSDKSVLMDGICYSYDGTKTNWYKAKERCAAIGMHLATVQSPKQIEKIMKAVTSDTTLDCWTGGNDLDIEGRFVWDESDMLMDNEISSQTKTRPEQKLSDCVYINNERSLNETLCSEPKSALCMYRVPPPAYYFGENNSYLCHCLEGACDEKGYCNSSQGRCATGWFGEGCQFRSLTGDRHGTLGVLADNDVKTCTSEMVLPLAVKLRPGSMFTSIRIVSNIDVYIHGVQIYIRLDRTTLKCLEHQLMPRKKYTDIIFKPVVAEEVIISWEGDTRICDFYVSGEQNFALLQSAAVPDKTDPTVSLPVDGRRGPADGCYEGHPKVGDQTWTLTFSTPTTIREIIIYRKPKVSGYDHMTGFYVQGISADGELRFRYNDSGQNANKSTVWILTHVSEYILKIVISIDNANDQRHLELCEVEAFGECATHDGSIFCYVCNRTTCDGECQDNKCHSCFNGTDADGKMKWTNLSKWLTIILIILVILVVLMAFNICRKQHTKERVEPPGLDDGINQRSLEQHFTTVPPPPTAAEDVAMKSETLLKPSYSSKLSCYFLKLIILTKLVTTWVIGSCSYTSWSSSFGHEGQSMCSGYSQFMTAGDCSCDEGYYLTGLYKAKGDGLRDLKYFYCCSMAKKSQRIKDPETLQMHVMDITFNPLVNLADRLGYAWPYGRKGLYLGDDFVRKHDRWEAGTDSFHLMKIASNPNAMNGFLLSTTTGI
ncbi:hypothetical protein Btru_070385 [Bulinus truncatus]|nr:hypothetical protein Btru_070385 [Bulinus truncatus]